MESKTDASSPSKMGYDYSLIGYNIRCSRMARNKTQAELAALALVDRSTVRRIEAGQRVHLHSIEKISGALGRPVALIHSLMPYGTPGQIRVTHVHRKADLMWFASRDTRKGVPKDNQALLQSDEERHRLAKLGLVEMFEAYMATMPYGPSVSIAEICGLVSISPHETYHSCLLVCLRGEIILRNASEVIRLGEGDSAGISTDNEATIEPASPIGKDSLPPLIFFVMANRKGHAPMPFRQTTRKRIRH